MIRATTEEERYLTKFTNGTGSGFADASAAQGGTGTSFRPHELLEAALATCINVTLRMYAEKYGIPLEDVTTEVKLDQSSMDESVFQYDIELHGSNLTAEEKTKLLDVAKGCSVRRVLSRNIRFDATSDHTPTAAATARANSW
jgi:putative redox protein